MVVAWSALMFGEEGCKKARSDKKGNHPLQSVIHAGQSKRVLALVQDKQRKFPF